MAIDIDFGALRQTNPFEAYGQGQEFAAKQAQRQASVQAGRALASGDRAGAQEALGSVGDVNSVRTLQADQTAENAATRDQALAKQKTDAELLLKVTGDLQTIPAGQRSAALKSAYPLFQAAGIDTSHFDGLTEDQLSDAGLAAFAGAVKKEAGYTLVPGGKHFDANNKLVAEAPFAPQYRTVRPEDKLIGIGETPDGASNQSRGARNNNPLNLTSLPHGQWEGQTGTDGKFATFSTPEAGFAAADKNLQAYGTNHGITTLSGIINRWAPSSENDTGAYVGTVAKDLNIDPNATINLADASVRQKILQSMSKVELGQGSAALPEGRVIAEGNPKTFKPDTVKPPRVPAAAITVLDNHQTALQTASAMNTKMGNIKQQLKSGELDLGPVKNVFARGQNAIGLSSGASQAYASLRADLEKVRNDSLRLNKGVQTEGDAQRAWKELLSNLNDPKVVLRRLEEIEGYNRQAEAFHKDSIVQLREDVGLPPIDPNKFNAKPLDIAKPATLPRRSVAPTAPHAMTDAQLKSALGL